MIDRAVWFSSDGPMGVVFWRSHSWSPFLFVYMRGVLRRLRQAVVIIFRISYLVSSF